MADKFNHAITFKVTDDVARQVAGVAVLDGSDGSSEWVRHLVLRELDRRKQQRDALNSIFAASAMDGEGYSGSRGLPASEYDSAPTRSKFHG